jgi:hypothetical protein
MHSKTRGLSIVWTVGLTCGTFRSGAALGCQLLPMCPNRRSQSASVCWGSWEQLGAETSSYHQGLGVYPSEDSQGNLWLPKLLPWQYSDKARWRNNRLLLASGSSWKFLLLSSTDSLFCCAARDPGHPGKFTKRHPSHA